MKGKQWKVILKKKKKKASVCTGSFKYRKESELAVWTFKLKQELLAGHLGTVTASEDSSLLYVPNCLMLTTAKGRLWEASFYSVYSIKSAKTFTPKWELGILDKLAGKGKYY